MMSHVNFTYLAEFFLDPEKVQHSSEISPTRCKNCVFILRNGFTLHVSGDNLTHHQEYICCIWPPSKSAHLGCKFLSDVSVVNSPIVVELLVITALFCVALPAIVASCWTYFTTIKHDARNHKY